MELVLLGVLLYLSIEAAGLHLAGNSSTGALYGARLRSHEIGLPAFATHLRTLRIRRPAGCRVGFYVVRACLAPGQRQSYRCLWSRGRPTGIGQSRCRPALTAAAPG